MCFLFITNKRVKQKKKNETSRNVYPRMKGRKGFHSWEKSCLFATNNPLLLLVHFRIGKWKWGLARLFIIFPFCLFSFLPNHTFSVVYNIHNLYREKIERISHRILLFKIKKVKIKLLGTLVFFTSDFLQLLKLASVGVPSIIFFAPIDFASYKIVY